MNLKIIASYKYGAKVRNLFEKCKFLLINVRFVPKNVLICYVCC